MPNSLQDPAVASTLDRLHAAAKRDWIKMLPVLPGALIRAALGKSFSEAVSTTSMKDVFIPVDRDQGEFLYLLLRATGAKTVVEFGTSFGISTIYLAAAMRDNGGGQVIGSEIEPDKAAKAREHLAEAGLADLVDVRLGDARETLKELPEPVDFLLLDGWKDLYVPILELVKPRLRPGAIIAADNIFTFKRTLRPYVDYVQSPLNGFQSATLDMSDGFEFSVYMG
jgi:predicted O-methyltransferase YrrM